MAFVEGHDRLLDVALLAADAAEALHLALADERVDAFTLTSNSFSTAALICGLVAFGRTLKTTWFCSETSRRLLGDHRRTGSRRSDVEPAHLNRASSASTAALVSTSFSRRRMS